jgi:hypothetical protein
MYLVNTRVADVLLRIKASRYKGDHAGFWQRANEIKMQNEAIKAQEKQQKAAAAQAEAQRKIDYWNKRIDDPNVTSEEQELASQELETLYGLKEPEIMQAAQEISAPSPIPQVPNINVDPAQASDMAASVTQPENRGVAPVDASAMQQGIDIQPPPQAAPQQQQSPNFQQPLTPPPGFDPGMGVAPPAELEQAPVQVAEPDPAAEYNAIVQEEMSRGEGIAPPPAVAARPSFNERKRFKTAEDKAQEAAQAEVVKTNALADAAQARAMQRIEVEGPQLQAALAERGINLNPQQMSIKGRG